MQPKTQTCSSCKQEFPATLEYFGKHKSRGIDTYCSPCRRAKTLANYYKNKEKWNATTRRNRQLQKDRINEYKDNCSCKKCGESRNYLLDFHHIDPSTKSFQISQGEAYGWKKLKEEIRNCMVLCSNCHRDFHFLEKKIGISVEEYVHSGTNK